MTDSTFESVNEAEAKSVAKENFTVAKKINVLLGGMVPAQIRFYDETPEWLKAGSADAVMYQRMIDTPLEKLITLLEKKGITFVSAEAGDSEAKQAASDELATWL
jgi:hypothetical protein